MGTSNEDCWDIIAKCFSRAVAPLVQPETACRVARSPSGDPSVFLDLRPLCSSAAPPPAPLWLDRPELNGRDELTRKCRSRRATTRRLGAAASGCRASRLASSRRRETAATCGTEFPMVPFSFEGELATPWRTRTRLVTASSAFRLSLCTGGR